MRRTDQNHCFFYKTWILWLSEAKLRKSLQHFPKVLQVLVGCVVGTSYRQVLYSFQQIRCFFHKGICSVQDYRTLQSTMSYSWCPVRAKIRAKIEIWPLPDTQNFGPCQPEASHCACQVDKDRVFVSVLRAVSPISRVNELTKCRTQRDRKVVSRNCVPTIKWWCLTL